MNGGRAFSFAVVAGAVVFGVLIPVQAQTPQEGRQIYDANCAGCHGSDGEGVVGTFPPLAGNARAQDEVYVAEVIRNGLSGPIEVGGVVYDSTMAPFANLSDSQIASLTAFLATDFQVDVGDSTTTTSTTAGDGITSPTPRGDPRRGENLFVGRVKLEGGGVACGGCHTAGRQGNLGGSSLGPDLTDAFDRFGEQGLVGALQVPAFVVMQETYADRAISQREAQDLAAFLSRAASEERNDSENILLFLGLIGAGALFALIAVVRPYRGTGYSRWLRRYS